MVVLRLSIVFKSILPDSVVGVVGATAPVNLCLELRQCCKLRLKSYFKDYVDL